MMLARDNVSCVHCIIPSMAELPKNRVCSVELFRNGVIITFSDGKCALFPAEILYATLPKAQELSDNDDEELGN
jgi:hypothetical protein